MLRLQVHIRFAPRPEKSHRSPLTAGDTWVEFPALLPRRIGGGLYYFRLSLVHKDQDMHQSNFSRLRERLVESKVALRFFDAVVREARRLNLLSDEHFTLMGR